MQGFAGKPEGLVNAGDIAKTRVDNPKDHLKRDQEVWVKVISLAGGKIRLSMRDVDQKTGQDLVPMGKLSAGDQWLIHYAEFRTTSSLSTCCYISGKAFLQTKGKRTGEITMFPAWKGLKVVLNQLA